MSNGLTKIECSLCKVQLLHRARRGKKNGVKNIVCETCAQKFRKKCGLCGVDFAPSSLKGTRFSYCLTCARSYNKNYRKNLQGISESLSERECLWCLQIFMPAQIRSKCCSHSCNTSHNSFMKHSGQKYRSSKLGFCKCGKLIDGLKKFCFECKRAQCSIDNCEDPVRSSGMCNAHFIRKRKGIDLTASRSELRRKPRCSFDGCDRPKNHDDLCRFHLKRRELGIALDAPSGYRPPQPPKLCTHLGCEKKRDSYGLCSTHRHRKQKGIDLDAPVGYNRKYTNEICLMQDCGRPHVRKGYGLCQSHLNAKTRRRYKNGLHWLPLGDRDGWLCHLCGWVVDQSAGTWKNPTGATVDHLIPRSKGGSDEWDNVRLAHYGCNHKRSNTDLELSDVQS